MISMRKGKSIGKGLEFTVSEVLNSSVDELIDQGKRFTIVNDEKKDEEEARYGNGVATD